MTRIPTVWTSLCALLLASSAAAGAAAAGGPIPVTASPGDTAGFVEISGSCPTFSWGAVPGARYYELAVYSLDPQGVAEALPRLLERFPGSVTAWTPPLELCLESGLAYAWSVRALVGSAGTPWSPSRFFQVSRAPSVAEVEEALTVLERFLGEEQETGSALGEAASTPEEPGAVPLAPRLPAGASSTESGALPVSLVPAGSARIDTEPAPAGRAEAPEVLALPTFVLLEGGIRFPDGSIQYRIPFDQSSLNSLRITGAGLRPRENDVSWAAGGEGGCLYVTAGDASTIFNTPVYLPQGAVVNSLRMYYDDTSGSDSVAFFTVYDLYGSIVQEWSVSSSGNTGNGFSDSAVINHTIDYDVYNYLVNYRPTVVGTTLQLCGFRIFFTG